MGLPAFFYRLGNQRSVPSWQKCDGPDVRRKKAMCGTTTKRPHMGPTARARSGGLGRAPGTSRLLRRRLCCAPTRAREGPSAPMSGVAAH